MVVSRVRSNGSPVQEQNMFSAQDTGPNDEFWRYVDMLEDQLARIRGGQLG